MGSIERKIVLEYPVKGLEKEQGEEEEEAAEREREEEATMRFYGT